MARLLFCYMVVMDYSHGNSLSAYKGVAVYSFGAVLRSTTGFHLSHKDLGVNADIS